MYSKANPLLEALGYDSSARLVIFHADDIGMSRGSNQAYLALHEAGMVKTGSVMVPCPWANEILTLAQAKPELDLGVHLTLTCEYEHYRWGPISQPTSTNEAEKSGLVASDGRFWTSNEALGHNVHVDAADREVRSQVAYMHSLGIPFTHIDTHMGASLIPRLSASYVTLGFEYRVPLLITRKHLLDNNRVDDLVRFETMGMALVDEFRITPVYTENPPSEPSAHIYEAVLEALSPGIT